MEIGGRRHLSILIQFLFRLAFGLALAMAVTPARFVTSGFYRVHLLVVLGLSTLAAVAGMASADSSALWPAVVVAVLSYVGSVAWLYERPALGKVLLVLVACTALAGGWLTLSSPAGSSTTSSITWAATTLRWLATPLSGLVLGFTITAMLLGHWYLNTPTMDLVPLLRLVRLMAAAALARGAACGVGTALQLYFVGVPAEVGVLFWPLLALRWLAGLVGVLVLAWMTWQTLKIPNTQSATGILYVALIGTFVGELAGQLLSAGSTFPL